MPDSVGYYSLKFVFRVFLLFYSIFILDGMPRVQALTYFAVYF